MTLVLVPLALLHFYWAAGGRTGRGVAVPELRGRPAFQPGPLACILVGMLLLAAALVLLGRSGAVAAPLPFPPWIFGAGSWTIAAVFALRAIGDFQYFGFFRRVTGTPFAHNDALFYTPLCLALAILASCISLFSMVRE
jgi:Protein of unknown function (DUF3995)